MADHGCELASPAVLWHASRQCEPIIRALGRWGHHEQLEKAIQRTHADEAEYPAP
jgi:hypothetical protein